MIPPSTHQAALSVEHLLLWQSESDGGTSAASTSTAVCSITKKGLVVFERLSCPVK